MRLDLFLKEGGYLKSRGRAKEYIESGKVTVNGKTVTKCAYDVSDSDRIEVSVNEAEYVGRGAYKLEGALDTFGISVKGKKCIDVGASTGGFTEVLLRRGAVSVTAVDAGHGQLHPDLANDPRVTNVEGMNARYMTADDVGDGYDLAVMDVSFISQTYIFPSLLKLLSDDAVLITLVKPQFELDRRAVGNGVVKKSEHRYEALCRVYDGLLSYGYRVSDVICSSILGGDGNVEYLFMIEKGEENKSVRTRLLPLSKEK